MNPRLLFVLVLCCATPLRAQVGNPLTPQALPQPILSGKAEFRIPYKYDANEIARLGAQEIRLYVSTNRGAQWQLVQSVAPQSGKFHFRAPADGDYWFSVQTVDAQGNFHPGGAQMQPGLIVRVDTTQPIFRLSLQPVGGGRVRLAWNANDPSLDINSITFQYTQTGMTDWQQLPVQRKAAGSTEWSIPAGGLVSVRGSIRDQAGNVTNSQANTQVAPTGSGSSSQSGTTRAPVVPDPRDSIATRDAHPILPPLDNATTDNRTPINNMGPRLDQGPRFSDPSLQALPPLPQFQNNETPVPGIPNVARRDNSELPSQSSLQQTLPFENPNRSLQPPMPLNSPFTENTRPDPFRKDTLVSQGAPATTTQVPFTSSGGDSSYRLVRSRKFNIDYRIDDIGPSGVGSVEMYVTQDNGEKWYRYGVDKDRRSPFEVEVPGDGIYGFSMRVVSGAGLSDEPPRAGERPEIVIVADTSPPVVKLFPLKQGTGPNTNKILISWQASDHKLADEPIALSYSANQNGPWEPITGWQKNTGQHVWNIGRGVPARLFIRLIARDAAGNMSRVETPQPVLVDLAKPSARIVDVEATRTGY